MLPSTRIPSDRDVSTAKRGVEEEAICKARLANFLDCLRSARPLVSLLLLVYGCVYIAIERDLIPFMHVQVTARRTIKKWKQVKALFHI
jgi:hypothetical protein